ncbi:hypothetical protein SAMN05428949_1396 [Chitinophaga sp. YR627]|uniref:hypothetical protein n=1 Tax=Chitinophaga sp. YR627 TaxID=1881041 RepID=UPI0008E4DFF3|nr:hypothetical protein [Chitinophaga sp. YR627]SFM93998.1 hypothetical protein SAMN05428949_1396 [Chitinophaga sp. YR627]
MKNTQVSRYKYLLYTLLVAGATSFIACGGGAGSHSDSTTVGGTEQPTVTPDTAPAAEVPPGAINPGEDSSRYGTGVADSSKNRQK